MRSELCFVVCQAAVAYCEGNSASSLESTPVMHASGESPTPAGVSGQVHSATGMPTFVQKHPEELYRKYDKSWDDHYQANARFVTSALASLSQASSSFQCFKDSVRSKISRQRMAEAVRLGPFDESIYGPSRLFNLLREKCPFAFDDPGVRPNYDFLLAVAACEVFPFLEMSSGLVYSIYSQERCSEQAAPLASKLKSILSSIGSLCSAHEEQVMSSETNDQYAVFEAISSQQFKHMLKDHLAELERMVAEYVKMINSIYVFPLLKYGKYSGYLRKTNCLAANQLNAIVSMIECFLSLELKTHETGERTVDPSFGESLSKLSVDLFIRLAGCDSDCKKLFAQKPAYVSEAFRWVRFLNRYVRRSTREMDRLWGRLSTLPERVSRLNPFAENESLELLNEVEALKADVKEGAANGTISAPEARLKLDELNELATVFMNLQVGHKDRLLEICAPPTVESIKGALDSIFEAIEELIQIPRALTLSRIEDLQSTLEHQSTRLDHIKDPASSASQVEVLRKDIGLLDARLKGLAQASAEVEMDVLVVIFIGTALAMYLMVSFLRKVYRG